MSTTNPLETYLSPRIRRPPPFIYLHHPFHSSPHALPAPLFIQDESIVTLATVPTSSARIIHDKIVLTIPATSLTSPKSLYTLVLHLVRLCLFPESVQKEIQEKGRVREVHQWDTFVKGLSRVMEADATAMEANVGEKRKRGEDDAQPDQAVDMTGTASVTRRTLVIILQDAHLLAKNIGTAFESMLRLFKMVSVRTTSRTGLFES